MKAFLSDRTTVSIQKGGKDYPAFEKNGKTVPAGKTKNKVVLQNDWSKIELTFAEFDELRTHSIDEAD